MINMPGGPEMMVIVLIALIVLGPKELPKVMRTVGNAMAEVRKVSSGFQNEMKNAMNSLTDEGSSSSATTKAKSGTMTAVATPPDDDSTPGDEVVARNTDPVSESTGDAGSDGDPSPATSEPVIDPADRAAG